MKKFLKNNNILYYYNYPLKNITTIRNKGNCKYYILINSFEELKTLIKYLTIHKKKYFIIGNGSKIVFKKNKFSIIISLKNLNKIKIKDYVEVEAGCMISSLIKELKKESLGGIEALIGIPATIGGILKNNASSHGVSLYDFLDSIIVLKNNKICKIKKENINYEYRKSSLNNCIILKCYFTFDKMNKNEIKEKIKMYLDYRKKNQEINYPNIGSIFKNSKYKAYEIIKKYKLENYKFKKIKLSKKHCNFLKIENDTDGKDVYKFVKKLQKRIYKESKIKFNTEIIFI